MPVVEHYQEPHFGCVLKVIIVTKIEVSVTLIHITFQNIEVIEFIYCGLNKL